MLQRVQFRLPVELSVLSPRESVMSKMGGRYHRFCADNSGQHLMCLSCGLQRVATGIVQCCNGYPQQPNQCQCRGWEMQFEVLRRS